jgi:hypothetical protein
MPGVTAWEAGLADQLLHSRKSAAAGFAKRTTRQPATTLVAMMFAAQL